MKNTVFTDILQKISKYFLVLVGIVVLLIACSGIRIVSSGSSAIILRFGKLVGKDRESQVHEPGLLFALPYMIDEVVIIPTGEILSVCHEPVTGAHVGPGMLALYFYSASWR